MTEVTTYPETLGPGGRSHQFHQFRVGGGERNKIVGTVCLRCNVVLECRIVPSQYAAAEADRQFSLWQHHVAEDA